MPTAIAALDVIFGEALRLSIDDGKVPDSRNNKGGAMQVSCESREMCAVAWLKGNRHKYYEDAFRMLPRDIPLVSASRRGELFAVFDGIGSAPEGRHAAQVAADFMLQFYREPEKYPARWESVQAILLEANRAIYKVSVQRTPLSMLGVRG